MQLLFIKGIVLKDMNYDATIVKTDRFRKPCTVIGVQYDAISNLHHINNTIPDLHKLANQLESHLEQLTALKKILTIKNICRWSY